MILFTLFTLGEALNIFTTQFQVMKNGEVAPEWRGDSADAYTCHPVPTFYEDPMLMSRTFTLSNEETTMVTITASSSNSEIKLGLSSSFFTLSPDNSIDITLEYICSSDSWAEIQLQFMNQGHTETLKFVKICGEISMFDWSYAFLALLACAVVFLSAYFSASSGISENSQDGSIGDIYTLVYLGLFIVLALVLSYIIGYIGLLIEIVILLTSVVTLTFLFDELTSKIPWRGTVSIPKIGEVYSLSIASFLAAALIVFIYIFARFWILTNLITISFAFIYIKNQRISSVKAGILLLTIVFFYELFWGDFTTDIFGNHVIVTKRYSVDLPIKLLWPYMSHFAMARSCNMIGLGDLVIPGVFMSLAARYDNLHSTRYLFLLTFMYFTGNFICICVAVIYVAPLLVTGMIASSAYQGRFRRFWTGKFAEPLKFDVPMQEFN